MKKRILAIAVVAGLGAAPLALAQTGLSSGAAGSAEVRAEVGHYFGKWAIKKANGRLNSVAGGVQAASEGGGAALGGLLGFGVAGPVGTVFGAAIGAA